MTAPHTGAVLALDIGGTTAKAALFAPDGTVLFEARSATRSRKGPEALATVLDFVSELMDRAKADAVPVSAVGVACCGIVDERSGIAVFSAAFGWRDVPLRDLIAERARVPVALGHDVRAGALAEARIGAGRGHQDFLFVTIGTGVGAALVVDGRPLGGGNWRAAEVGHLVVRPDGEPCGCGQRGCVSTVVGGPVLVNNYRRAGGTADPADAAGVVALAQQGDGVARAVWSELVDVLAEGLAAAVTLLDPTAVVVGGGLAEAGDPLFEPLRGRLAARLTFQVMPRIHPALLGERAGRLGAAVLAREAAG